MKINSKILIYLFFVCATAIGQKDSTLASHIGEGDIFIFHIDFSNHHHIPRVSSEESKSQVKELVSLLSSHPKLKFELSYHTDYRGSNKNNLKLSKHIADSFFNYLIHNYKIDKEQAIRVGYGEEKPIITEEIIKSMYNKESKDKAMQINRRFELKALLKLTKE